MSIYTTTTPYFYIIRHVASGKMYAGSRWATGCDPKELLQEDGYHTSSEKIKSMIKADGLNSFEIVLTDHICDGKHPYEYESHFLQSNKCARSDKWLNMHDNNSRMMFGQEEFYDKAKQTWIQNYGVDHPSKSKIIDVKKRLRNLEKYGVEYNFQIPEVQEQIKQNRLQLYGVEHAQQRPDIQEKTRKTNIEKYGYEYGLLSPKVQAKRLETLEQNYGVGVTNVFQTEEIKSKIRNTCKEKYGTDSYMSSNIGKEAYKKKLEARYGEGITNQFQVKFLCLLETKREYTKAAISRWHPEFKQYY